MKVDENWTLFLDRDGVINQKIANDYVKKIEDFKFIDGALEALTHFALLFKKILIVTNQQGIGKGVMTIEDLNSVHKHMLATIKSKGGRIDGIYFSPHLESENSIMRKPKPGMFLKAQKDFTNFIDFKKSLMVGDSNTDIEAAKELGIKSVFIAKENTALADFCYPSLLDFSIYLGGNSK